jgi:hypothetical protein
VKIEGNVSQSLQQAIRNAGNRTLVYCDVDPSFSIQMRKQASGVWVPEGFVRRVLPDRKDYSDLPSFMAARCDYFASRWIMDHQGKPYFYCPACPPARREDGTWWGHTGPAVISGWGLEVVLSAEGELVEIKEIFSPD